MSARFALVDAIARSAFGEGTRWRFFVPGRLEVFGKHTDYGGGHSLVAAVPRGFTVVAAPGYDGTVTVIDAVSGGRVTFDIDALQAATATWHRYIATVVRRLAANFPGTNLSARIVFASDLPRAAGISSSSALVIAVAQALIARAGIEETEAWRSAITSVEDRASYFGCIENGASFRSLAGAEGVGTHGGSEDHAAILASQAGHLQQFSFTPLRLDRRVAVPSEWTFAVGSTGVRASKAAGARGDYNRLSADLSAVLAAWRDEHPDDLRSLGALATAGALADFAPPAHLAARLEHFLSEDARVLQATEAFARGDIARIGVLADASQRDAARLLRNQVPETIDMVSMARDAGAAAASGFGAGWGGSVWALVPCAEADEFLARWLGAYRGRYPHSDADGFLAPPSNGLMMEGN